MRKVGAGVGTHHVGGTTAPLCRVTGAICCRPVGIVIAVPHSKFTLSSVSFINHQVYGHFAFQT